MVSPAHWKGRGFGASGQVVTQGTLGLYSHVKWLYLCVADGLRWLTAPPTTETSSRTTCRSTLSTTHTEGKPVVLTYNHRGSICLHRLQSSTLFPVSTATWTWIVIVIDVHWIVWTMVISAIFWVSLTTPSCCSSYPTSKQKHWTKATIVSLYHPTLHMDMNPCTMCNFGAMETLNNQHVQETIGETWYTNQHRQRFLPLMTNHRSAVQKAFIWALVCAVDRQKISCTTRGSFTIWILQKLELKVTLHPLHRIRGRFKANKKHQPEMTPNNHNSGSSSRQQQKFLAPCLGCWPAGETQANFRLKKGLGHKCRNGHTENRLSLHLWCIIPFSCNLRFGWIWTFRRRIQIGNIVNCDEMISFLPPRSLGY